MLNSSPAAVTQSLQLLEDSAQLQLVSRTTSGVVLTEYGQAMLAHARLILSQMSRAQEAIEAIRGNTRRRLSVAVSPWVALTFLPAIVMRFRERMPQVQLEFFEGVLAIANPRLRDGSIDIFIGRQSPGSMASEFTYRPLFATGLAVVARQDHPYATSSSLADLLDLDWLVAMDPETEGHVPFSMFERYSLQAPRSIHFMHSMAVSVALLKGTDMISLFPWPLIELCATRDGLCAIPVREQLDNSTVGIITRTGEPLDAASRCFVDCLIETVRDDAWTKICDVRRTMHSVDILV
jgi:DNA-binding transcriptional LysR family regulator